MMTKLPSEILCLLLVLDYSSSFSLPSSGFVKVKSWDQVVEPPAEGRRYGPNWSIEKNGDAKISEGSCGAMVWAIGNSTYTHPEKRSDFPVGKWLQSRPNLGICMSGGGLRAATCALGWYRGLNHLNLIRKTRYVGANSGATWTTMPLFCIQMLEKARNRSIDYDEYLGKYYGKEAVLKDRTESSKIGKVLIKSNIVNYTRDDNKTSFNDWSDAIDQNFMQEILKPVGNYENDFWLDLSNAYLQNKDGIDPKLCDDSFPFPIFVATAYQTTDVNNFVPIENTPLYCGIPVDPRSFGFKTTLGGGFVQGVALNAGSLDNIEPVPIDSENIYFKEFELPTPVVKVSELTAASSNFGAGGDAIVMIDAQQSWIKKILSRGTKILGFFRIFGFSSTKNITGLLDAGKYKWWSPTTGGEPVELNFVDGGLFDNFGVLALLRRGCSTVIVCSATDSDVLTTKNRDVGSKFYDIAALFGRSKGTLPWPLDKLQKSGYNKEELNRRSQVFAEKEFDALMDNMRSLRKDGKPLVVRKKLKLLKNTLAGIYESRDVDMIFCFNGGVDEFRKGYNPCDAITVDTDFSQKEVHDLSSIASYSLVEGLNNVNFDIEQVGK